MPVPQNPSRRFTSREAGLSDLWAFWNCTKHDGLSSVLDLSVGGLCLSIGQSERIVVGEKIHLDFLTSEGQIRTDAIVRRVRPERLLKIYRYNRGRPHSFDSTDDTTS